MLKTFLLISLCLGTLMCVRLRQAEIIPFEEMPLTDNMTISRDELRDAILSRMNNTLHIFNSFQLGSFLTDFRNRSLYMFERDHIGTGFTLNDFDITCYDECEKTWIPLRLRDLSFFFRAGSGLDQNLIGFRMRRDGTFQVTYNNIPLYRYYLDRNPGDVSGHYLFSHGGLWNLIDSTGKPIMTRI